MRITHKLGKERISKNVKRAGFLLTNKKKGYVYFSDNSSRYEGVFFQCNGNLYRVIAELNLNKKIDKIVNKFYCIEREVKGNKEIFFMPFNLNSISYELKKPGWINISLDVRETYDNRPFGRFYEITEEEGRLVVKYIKEGEYQFYIAIRPDELEYERIEKWESIFYKSDRERNSPPFESFIYSALRLKSKKLVISFSHDKEMALKESDIVFENLTDIKRDQERYVNKFLSGKILKSKRNIDFAYKSCINSLNQLMTKDGIIAGLPWFFQYWTRDEAISLKGLEDRKKKILLLRNLENIKEDGRIPTILSDLGSNADSVGWVFNRISESLGIFNKKEREFIKKKLVKSINCLSKNHIRDCFLFNKERETWMDTKERAGARIEIQALLLGMYNLAYKLTRKERYKKLEKELRQKVRQKFWNGEILADGLDDFTVRPNIFIAAYVYPKLLTKMEWIKCFENSLPKLWCDWGGLSTIDKENSLFTEKHTGEDPRSYHSGDSWYFLNNLTALVLWRTDRKNFERYIEKIVKASTNEILWGGMVGHHAELSSSSRQESEGCGAQAWSSAMFIELVDEILR